MLVNTILKRRQRQNTLLHTFPIFIPFIFFFIFSFFVSLLLFLSFFCTEVDEDKQDLCIADGGTSPSPSSLPPYNNAQAHLILYMPPEIICLFLEKHTV